MKVSVQQVLFNSVCVYVTDVFERSRPEIAVFFIRVCAISKLMISTDKLFFKDDETFTGGKLC
jgi:hypothetical protein